MSSDRRRRPWICRAVRADAAARAGRHGDGPGRRQRLCLSRQRRRRAQDHRSHLDAHGDRLHLRRHSDVPAHGRVRVQFRHEPRIVPRRQFLRRSFPRRARHRHHRGLRRLCRDLGLLGRHRGDLRHRRLSGNAALQLSAILRYRRHRRRRHARRHAAAFDRARGLRHHHRAGYRQAVHRRNHSGFAGGDDGHADRRRHRPRAAGFPPRGAAPFLEGAADGPARRLGDVAAVRLRHRRALWRPLHADRGRRRRRHRRALDRRRARQAEPARKSAARCCKPCAPPPRCSPS